MASVSRRGAVKVNPVTGAMTKLSDDELRARSEGMHRDGALLISDTYINAAKDLGLGGAEGMYQHIAGLKRVGATDVPVGDSMEREGVKPGSGRAAASSAPSSGRSAHGGASSSDVTAAEAAKSTLRTTATSTSRGGKIAGFARAAPSASSSLHTHADSFQRQKGVINTAHGVTDLKRHGEDAKPGERSGPRVVSMDTVDTLSKEGRARIEARERRDRLAGPAKPGATSGGIHTIAGKSRDAGAGFTVAAPSKRLPTASRVAKASAPLHAPVAAPTAAPSGSHKLGGGAKENDAAGIAASRAAFFKARLAEEEERKAAARAAAAADE